MITTASQSGAIRRLNQRERLRSSPYPSSKKTSTSKEISKKFKFVLVRYSNETILCDEIIVLRGLVELRSSFQEDDIRRASIKAINVTYSLLAEDDFSFMMASRRTLTEPVTSCQYDYNSVKLLIGQGSLYIMLKENKEFLLRDTFSTDEDDEILPTRKKYQYQEEPSQSQEKPSQSQDKPSQAQEIPYGLQETGDKENKGPLEEAELKPSFNFNDLQNEPQLNKVVSAIADYCLQCNII